MTKHIYQVSIPINDPSDGSRIKYEQHKKEAYQILRSYVKFEEADCSLAGIMIGDTTYTHKFNVRCSEQEVTIMVLSGIQVIELSK